MRENRDFVVPFNLLTSFAHASFSWATQHTTVCLVTSYYHFCLIRCKVNLATFKYKLVWFATDEPGSIVVCISPLIAIMKKHLERFTALAYLQKGHVDHTVKSRVQRGDMQL